MAHTLKPVPHGQHASAYAAALKDQSPESTMEELLGPEPELTFDVTTADLSHYSERALEGRRAHYDREYLFERDPKLRAAFKVEIERTDAELRRRFMYRTAEARRVFDMGSV